MNQGSQRSVFLGPRAEDAPACAVVCYKLGKDLNLGGAELYIWSTQSPSSNKILARPNILGLKSSAKNDLHKTFVAN